MVSVGFTKRIVALFSLLFGVVSPLLQFSAFATQNVTLAWLPSPGSDIAGYNVYYGLASGQYSAKVTVGDATRVTISGLTEGLTYFFTVTAFNNSGLESLPSNEVAYVVPGVLLTITKIQLGRFPNAFLIASTGVAPYPWVLEATENFKTWRTLFRGTNSSVNVTVVTYGTPALFFRLKSQ